MRRSFLATMFVTAPSLALATACSDRPRTHVVLDNRYAPSTPALVVDRAEWQAVSFQGPVLPGASSGPQSTIAASSNTAYVVLAPGWDPASAKAPTSFVVLQSRDARVGDGGVG